MDRQPDWKKNYASLMQGVTDHGVKHLHDLYHSNELHTRLGVQYVSGEDFLHDRVDMYEKTGLKNTIAYCKWLLTALLKERQKHKDEALPQIVIYKTLVKADYEWLTKSNARAAIQEA